MAKNELFKPFIMKQGANLIAMTFILTLIYGAVFIRLGEQGAIGGGLFLVSISLVIISFFLYIISLQLHAMRNL